MTLANVLILGGGGFVGTSIANRLANLGVKVTVPSRRRERQRQRNILLLPNVDLVQANIHDPATLERLMQGQDAVINLVGILHSRDFKLPYSEDFAQAHVELPKKIVAACKKTGVRRLLHMSALKASVGAPSEYLRSKADGEAVVLAAGASGDLDVTVFRPSVIFGPGDSFLTLFASLLKKLPFFPLGYGHAKFQPVFVGDVAEAFIRSVDDSTSFGRAYDLAGPKVYTLRQLVDYVNQLTGCKRPIIALPEFWALLQAGLLWLLPKPPMSPDSLRSMAVDSVVGEAATLPFAIVATPLEAAAPAYLGTRAPRAHYDQFRVKAGR